MSVVAWDGRIIAADKRGVIADTPMILTKLKRLPNGEVIGGTGDHDSCLMMFAWYEAGANPEKLPKCQLDKDRWGRLIVANADGVKFYGQEPVAIIVEDKFMAWGSGRDSALGAMYCGKSAREAVEIASLFDIGCGNGVDWFELKPKVNISEIPKTVNWKGGY